MFSLSQSSQSVLWLCTDHWPLFKESTVTRSGASQTIGTSYFSLKTRFYAFLPFNVFVFQQAYGRSYEMGQPVVNGAIYYHNGIPYTYQVQRFPVHTYMLVLYLQLWNSISKNMSPFYKLFNYSFEMYVYKPRYILSVLDNYLIITAMD